MTGGDGGSGSAGGRSRAAGWREAGKGSKAHEQMIRDLLSKGHKDKAARVAWDMGRPDLAITWFRELGLSYETGMCLADTGDAQGAMDELLQVPLDHKRYRHAATRVVELANELGAFDFEVDRFVNRFVAAAPASPREARAMLLLARHYMREGFADSAVPIVGRVLEFDPEHQIGLKMQRKLAGRGRSRRMTTNPPAAGEEDKRDLPELPPLDGFAESGARLRPRSSQPPAQSGPPPAQSGPPPAQSGPPPAQSGSPPAQSAPPPAQSGPPPAQSGPPPQMAPPQQSEAPSERAAAATQDAPPSNPPAAPGAQPAPPAAGPPGPGQVIAGRYELQQELGEGGMATVFRARDLELDQDIALKLMHGGHISDAWLPRFKQELALSRELTHKNIVRVHDIGTHQGHKFISMELLAGRPLDEILYDRLPDFGTGIHYLVQTCAGLRVAHDKGVIHRDIKPGNLFVTKEGVVKLMDFGIAKAPNEKGMTVAGSMVGTPDYMSPEQFDDSSSVQVASDLYSLGIVMYELFTGTVPFESEKVLGLMRMHMEDPPQSARERNPRIPDSLDALILRLLAKEPEQRPQSATEVARELRSIAKELR